GRTGERRASSYGPFHEGGEILEVDGVGRSIVVHDIELGGIPIHSESQSVFALHPVQAGFEVELILVHARISEAGAGSKLETTVDGRVSRGNVDLREGGRAQQIYAKRGRRERLAGGRVGMQASKTGALFPGQRRREDYGVRDRCHV